MARADAHRTTLSSLIREPFVRVAFEAAERDGLAPLAVTCRRRLMAGRRWLSIAKLSWPDTSRHFGTALTRFPALAVPA
jgi:hypothetical protein